MLILSRKTNESIVIGDNIRITVASIRGRCVRIGIEAPMEVGVFREELCFDLDTVPSICLERAQAEGVPQDPRARVALRPQSQAVTIDA